MLLKLWGRGGGGRKQTKQAQIQSNWIPVFQFSNDSSSLKSLVLPVALADIWCLYSAFNDRGNLTAVQSRCNIPVTAASRMSH
jgi:hypothetical protein